MAVDFNLLKEWTPVQNMETLVFTSYIWSWHSPLMMKVPRRWCKLPSFNAVCPYAHLIFVTCYTHNGSWFQLVQGMYTGSRYAHSNFEIFMFGYGMLRWWSKWSSRYLRYLYLYFYFMFDDMLYWQRKPISICSRYVHQFKVCTLIFVLFIFRYGILRWR